MSLEPVEDGSRLRVEDHPLDRVAVAVRAVPGVADLFGGAFGEIGTHLPGRRISGLRIRGDRTEVTLVAEFGRDLNALASAVRSAATPYATGEVDVVIGDVVPATSWDGHRAQPGA